MTEAPIHFRLPYTAEVPSDRATLIRWYDELLLLAVLQGLANRDAPRLYLLGVRGPDGQDLDTFWWERMSELGWDVARRAPQQAHDLADVLRRFGHHARGLVLWDPSVPATVNVALTLAGCLDLLPVAHRPDDPASLFSQLRAAGWQVAERLPAFSGRDTGSAKCDAYLWAQARFLETGRTSATHMHYAIDADWLRVAKAGGAFWNNTLLNHDWYIAHRAFFFDLGPWDDEAPVDDPDQPAGTDARTLRAILGSAQRRAGDGRMIHVGGFPPWAFKYTTHGQAGGHHDPVPTEWRYAQILSAHNAYMEADALGYSALANASFTRHLPLEERHPQEGRRICTAMAAQRPTAPDAPIAERRTFAFYVGDFDAPAWLYQVLPSLWNDPARGSVPLSWAINPNLADRMAPALAWTRATRTPLDTFVAGDSGAGYVNPGALVPPRESGLPSGLPAWTEHCRRYYERWDIRVTGFLLEGFAPSLGEEGLRAYAEFSPGGVVGQKLPACAVVDGMPVVRIGPDIGGRPEDAARTVVAMFAESGRRFGVARAILQKPSWYREVADRVQAADPSIEVVDLVTLLARVAEGGRVTA